MSDSCTKYLEPFPNQVGCSQIRSEAAVGACISAPSTVNKCATLAPPASSDLDWERLLIRHVTRIGFDSEWSVDRRQLTR